MSGVDWLHDMKKDAPVSVRLSLEIIRRLDQAAENIGLGNRTSLIKMSVSSFLDYFDRHGMTGLPLNWKEILHDLDGRTHRYQNIKVNAHQAVVNGGEIHNHAPAERKRGGKTRQNKP